MEFNFDINEIIPYEISVYDYNLNIINTLNAFDEDDRPILTRDLKQKLAGVIDKIGYASSQSQGLKDVITSYRKFSMNDNHRIYLMKDINEQSGRGYLVGLLKIGKKNLFVHDIQGNQHELYPLCVLDFYVHTSQQRKGYGKRLFDFMLKNEKINPKHLAVDNPSEKSVRFLNKHYGLSNPIQQINKFVVYPGFFDNRDDMMNRNNRRNKLESFSAGVNLNNHLYKNYTPVSEIDLRKNLQKPMYRTDSMDERINLKINSAFIPSKIGNEFLNQQQTRLPLNPHIVNKQYSAPNLEKIPFPNVIATTKNYQINNNNINNSTTTTTNNNNNNNYIIKTPIPTPPHVNPSTTILSPIENRSQNHYNNTKPISSIIQQTEYEKNFKNLNYNKNDPFPSLNTAKPPIYGGYQNTNNQRQTPPTNIQPTSFNQINKYSPFPSLQQTTNYNNQHNKINNQPIDALYLDRYRKTKLW